MPDLTAVAAELYGVPPGEFTAARTAAVRAARADGDRDLARAVGALRKPSAAAAAVNLLVRERPDDLGELLDLGVRLREAQAALAGTDLRALHAEQRRRTADVVAAAVDLLTDRGGSVGAAAHEQVEATLRAAMGDPGAAAAVATGLLTRDLFSSGLEPVDVDGAVAVPDAPPLAGAPARRTPLRAVPDEREGAGTPEDAPAPRAGRRRGRLITADEPDEQDGTDPPAAPGRRRRGRLVTLGDREDRGDRGDPQDGDGGGAAAPGAGDDDAPDDARPRTPARATNRGAARSSAGAGGGGGGTRADRERVEREGRAEEKRRADAERAAEREAERERRRAAARRAAQEDVALARADADSRRAAREAAEERLRAAEDRQAELTGLVQRTQDELARLREALAAAEQEAREVGLEVRHARSARGTAAKAAERADERLRAAERDLDRL